MQYEPIWSVRLARLFLSLILFMTCIGVVISTFLLHIQTQERYTKFDQMSIEFHEKRKTLEADKINLIKMLILRRATNLNTVYAIAFSMLILELSHITMHPYKLNPWQIICSMVLETCFVIVKNFVRFISLISTIIVSINIYVIYIKTDMSLLLLSRMSFQEYTEYMESFNSISESGVSLLTMNHLAAFSFVSTTVIGLSVHCAIKLYR